MKWLLLSNATEMKVLNFSNHRQAKPARKHNLGWSRRRTGAQAWGCTLVRVCSYALSAALLQGSNSGLTSCYNCFTGGLV